MCARKNGSTTTAGPYALPVTLALRQCMARLVGLLACLSAAASTSRHEKIHCISHSGGGGSAWASLSGGSSSSTMSLIFLFPEKSRLEVSRDELVLESGSQAQGEKSWLLSRQTKTSSKIQEKRGKPGQDNSSASGTTMVCSLAGLVGLVVHPAECALCSNV